MTYITAYATDEDIAIRCRTDYELLCSREYMASGSDGVFAPGSLWTMTSATNDFTDQGLKAGHVIILKEPSGTFGTIGAFFVVDHVDEPSDSLVLRRIGQVPGVGYPPAPPNGLINVKFIIPTLAAQIEAASYDINREYGISDLISGRRSSDLFDIREVREVTVLTVLFQRYLDLSRQAEVGGNDVYASKSRRYENLLSDLKARVTIHWSGGIAENQSNRSTRLARG